MRAIFLEKINRQRFGGQPRICDASLSRITAQRFVLRYKCIAPFLLNIKFCTEKVVSIFSIFGVIFKKSMNFFKFKRLIRSFVFLGVIFEGMASSDNQNL